MISMKVTKRLKIRQKLQASAILYLILIATVTYFFLSSNTLISKVSEQQGAMNSLLKEVRQTEIAIKEFVAHQISYDDLNQVYAKLDKRLKGNNLSNNFTDVRH